MNTRRYVPVIASVLFGAAATMAAGWPSDYQGVMLQGFYWDSFNDTKWTNLESQADELSKSFSLIWIPNSARDQQGGGRSMGYTPVYWFTNHNTIFGTEAELRSMIATYKEKGTGIIEDVVINHRCGVTNWTDFPAETWRGTTYKLGPEHICSTDEVRNQSGQAKPTGAPDTGDDFDGARDLDHTSAAVQDNCKAYCKFLLEDMGYAGFRYDMVKGYAGKYTKIYNEYSVPEFSVGEYWDGNYDAVKAWIDATGKTSAAFDFPFKYAVNDAFASNDLTKLVWKANGTNPQPAGMIHYGYQQYSVTFVDNHDTYRDGSKFTGNVIAANAFMLCSPGTPCVFLPHWKSFKNEIKRLIAVRNAVGVHNMSAVKVLQSSKDCYMAEVTGTNGKLVVKIGSAFVSPEGYTNDDIKTSGSDYCVWTKTNVEFEPVDPYESLPEKLYLVGHVNSYAWATDKGIEAVRDGSTYTFNNVTVNSSGTAFAGYFSFVTTLGKTWNDVNSSDRYGASTDDESIATGESAAIVRYPADVNASSAKSWSARPYVYNITADLASMRVTLSSPSGIDDAAVDADAEPEYYNLQGVRVDNPGPGIYIVRRGEAVTKEMIR